MSSSYTLKPIGFTMVDLGDGKQGKIYMLGLFDEDDNQVIEKMGSTAVPIVIRTEAILIEQSNILTLPERRIIQ